MSKKYYFNTAYLTVTTLTAQVANPVFSTPLRTTSTTLPSLLCTLDGALCVVRNFSIDKICTEVGNHNQREGGSTSVRIFPAVYAKIM